MSTLWALARFAPQRTATCTPVLPDGMGTDVISMRTSPLVSAAARCAAITVVVRQIVVPCVKRISSNLAQALRLFGLGLEADSAKDARRTREAYLRWVQEKECSLQKKSS
jgi:hypothetical protein